jgi:hypothetical protein
VSHFRARLALVSYSVQHERLCIDLSQVVIIWTMLDLEHVGRSCDLFYCSMLDKYEYRPNSY